MGRLAIFSRQLEMDTCYSEGLCCGYFVSYSQSIHLQVEASPGQSEGAGGLRDVSCRALEARFDHLPFEPFDGRAHRHVPMPARRRRRVVTAAGQDRREEIPPDEAPPAGHG